MDQEPNPKQPHFVCRQNREPLYFATIYAECEDGSLGCAILTEQARGSAAEGHDRMPLILNDDSLASWLAPAMMGKKAIRHLVGHIDADLIEHWPVSTAVNKPSEGRLDDQPYIAFFCSRLAGFHQRFFLSARL